MKVRVRGQHVQTKAPVLPTRTTEQKPVPESPTAEAERRKLTGRARDLPSSEPAPEGAKSPMETRIYEASPKHHAGARGNVSKAPTNGQLMLDRSVQVKPDQPRRVAADPSTGEFIVFDYTIGDKFHGHVRSWDQLEDRMQNALIKAGLATKRGKIVAPGAQRWSIEIRKPTETLSTLRSTLETWRRSVRDWWASRSTAAIRGARPIFAFAPPITSLPTFAA